MSHMKCQNCYMVMSNAIFMHIHCHNTLATVFRSYPISKFDLSLRTERLMQGRANEFALDRGHSFNIQIEGKSRTV